MSQFILSAFADEIDANFEKQMDVLALHDIHNIEIRGVNGRNIVEHTLVEVQELKNRLDERGFSISSIGSPIGKIKITDPFEPHLELFKHTIEIAKILKAPYIRMFSFFIPQGELPENYRDEVMSRWSQMVEASKGSGLILLHENEKDIYGDTAQRCLDILQTMNSPFVKAVFDPANFVQCNQPTYPEAWQLLKNHVVYMHIKDARSVDHQVTPAGEGDGCVPQILLELHQSGFCGFLSLEPHLASFEGFQNLEPNAKISVKISGDGDKKFAVATAALKKLLKSIK